MSGIVTCIKEGRFAFLRVLTYMLSILVNSKRDLTPTLRRETVIG